MQNSPPVGDAIADDSLRQRLREVGCRWFEEVWNRDNISYIEETIAPGCLLHGLRDDPLHGGWGFARFCSALKGAFPDLHFTVDHVVVDPPYMASMYTLRGTHTGGELGVPPTGREIAVSFMGLRHMPHGMMIETWNGYDRYHLFRQIGAGVTTLPDHIFPPYLHHAEATIAGQRGSSAGLYLCVGDWARASSARPRRDSSLRARPVGDIPFTRPTTAGHLSTPLSREGLHSWFHTVWQGDAGAAAAALRPSAKRSDLSGLTILPGIGGFARLRQIFRGAFPDIRCTVENALVEGEYGFVRATYSGTHTGSGLDVPPTGRGFEVEAMHLLQFDDGLVADIWSVVDLYTLFSQLGLLTTVVTGDITAQWLLPRGCRPDTPRDDMTHNTFLAVSSGARPDRT